jgi:nucleoside-diphosphate-sugar epimerase
MLDAIARQAELSTAWGRIFFLYGPHEHPDRLVPSVISSLLLNKQAQCTHGNQIRDFLYVRDVADAFVALLGSDVEGPVNIASGRPVLMKDIIQKIANRLARQDLIQLGAIHAPANEPPLLLADVRRLNTEVRWEPKYDLDLGLDETISWWKNQLLVRK